jgi:hypothetical protein
LRSDFQRPARKGRKFRARSQRERWLRGPRLRIYGWRATLHAGAFSEAFFAVACRVLKEAVSRLKRVLGQAPVILLGNIKRLVEKATGWRRSHDPQSLLREHKPQTYRFTDDGVILNHPWWQLIIYKSPVQLPQSLDPAAVFKGLFDSRDWGSWRNGICDYVHYHSRIHEVLGIARGSGRVRFGGTKDALSPSERTRSRPQWR